MRAIYRTNLKLLGLALVCGINPLQASESSNQNGQMPQGPFPWNYEGQLPRAERPSFMAGACSSTTPTPRVLIAGDSWAQYMWDDDAHNETFDKFGMADQLAVGRSLGSNPGPGHTGSEYAVSGSEAREWVDTANYPWIANVNAELLAEPSIDTVMLSIGGNDVLAGKSGGGWYKDMDLDAAGSEEAFFTQLLADSTTITSAITSVHPQVDVLLSSYEYPNFNVGFWCFIYACAKRNDLSRDPVNDLITDVELNAMMLNIESRRINWTNSDPGLLFDHGIGEMHYYYGDGVAAAGTLPRPGQSAPDYLPFPAGNPARPSLRENFRQPGGIDADPIHLDAEAYLYKVAVQTESTFFPKFRGIVSQTLNSLGGNLDGWSDGVSIGTSSIAIGDDGTRLIHGILSFDTSTIPDGENIESASLYLIQETRSGSNPFVTGNLGTPRLDMAGSFGAPEVEAGDATAAADVSDAGCFVGSANQQYYALRIDLNAAALAAIGREGITQFRLEFSNTDASINRVEFSDGDAPTSTSAGTHQTVHWEEIALPDGSMQLREVRGSALEHRGLVEVMGNAKPFLDIRYNDTIFRDGFDD